MSQPRCDGCAVGAAQVGCFRGDMSSTVGFAFVRGQASPKCYVYVAVLVDMIYLAAVRSFHFRSFANGA